MKLSSTVTPCPCCNNIGVSTDPKYPAPPVIRIFIRKRRDLRQSTGRYFARLREGIQRKSDRDSRESDAPVLNAEAGWPRFSRLAPRDKTAWSGPMQTGRRTAATDQLNEGFRDVAR